MAMAELRPDCDDANFVQELHTQANKLRLEKLGRINVKINTDTAAMLDKAATIIEVYRTRYVPFTREHSDVE